MESVLKDIYSNIPQELLNMIKDEIVLSDYYEIGKEYNEAKIQFYKKNSIFLDYDILTLKKMGIFEVCDINKDMRICDEDGFIINGPLKFLRLNIHTGTYYSKDGYNIDGLDENNYSSMDDFYNKHNFGRDGYYYELSSDGHLINTGSKLNPNNFDIKGNYYRLNQDGIYEKVGKINEYGFDIDGIFYRYNNKTGEYIKTNSLVDDKGFNINGTYCAIGNSIGTRIKEVLYQDGVTRVFEDVVYINGNQKVSQNSRFETNLPYDINYFDREGFYYQLDKNGNRVKLT